MSGKTADLYKKVFDFIEKNLIRLNPAQFMTDFEAGMRKTINEFYPNAVLYGCWYHFCAAVRRKFLSLDMYELITKVPAAKSIYRMIISLPLLPEESILNGYNIVKQEAIEKNLDKQFKEIFEYFEQYWLHQVSFYFNLNSTKKFFILRFMNAPNAFFITFL